MISILVGLLVLAAGLAAFVVPLHHGGPYGIPGRGLVGGLLCFALAGLLILRATPTVLRGVALVASPLVLFFALYGALAELEEVVVVYAYPLSSIVSWLCCGMFHRQKHELF